MGLNFDFIVKYLPWYIDAAILTVKIAFFGILFSLIIGIACSVVQYYRVPVIIYLSEHLLKRLKNNSKIPILQRMNQI